MVLEEPLTQIDDPENYTKEAASVEVRSVILPQGYHGVVECLEPWIVRACLGF